MANSSDKSKKKIKNLSLFAERFIWEGKNIIPLLETIKENPKVLINAPTGSGKTFASQYIAEIFLSGEVDKVIIASPFTCIAESLGKALDKPYAAGKITADQRSRAYESPVHYCTYDSLVAYLKKTTTRLDRTMIFLDETHELIKSYGFRDKAMSVALKAFNECKYGIALTGTPQPLLAELLNAKVINIFTEIGLVRDLTVFENNNLDLIINDIIHSHKGGTVVVSINSVKKILHIEQVLLSKGMSVGKITSRSLDEDSSELKKYLVENELIPDMDVLLCTSAIESGININNEEKEFIKDGVRIRPIDKIIYGQNAYEASPESIVQLGSRFRKTYYAKYSIYLGKTKPTTTKTIQECMRETSKSISNLLKTIPKVRVYNVEQWDNELTDKSKGVLKTTDGQVLIDNLMLVFNVHKTWQGIRDNKTIIEEVLQYNNKYKVVANYIVEAKKVKLIERDPIDVTAIVREFPEECATLCAYTEGFHELNYSFVLGDMDSEEVKHVETLLRGESLRDIFEKCLELKNLGGEYRALEATLDAISQKKFSELYYGIKFLTMLEQERAVKKHLDYKGFKGILGLKQLLGNPMSFSEVEKILDVKGRAVKSILDSTCEYTNTIKYKGKNSYSEISVTHIKTLEEVCEPFSLNAEQIRGFIGYKVDEEDFKQLFPNN